MKIAQTECETLTTKKTKTDLAVIQKQHRQLPTPSAAEVITLSASASAASLVNNENVCSNNASAATKTTSKMTDERNSESKGSPTNGSSTKNSNNNNNNNNNNERIIAEAAKILLKNGLNGSSAAVVAAAAATVSLLSVASTYPLPAPPPPPPPPQSPTHFPQPLPAHVGAPAVSAAGLNSKSTSSTDTALTTDDVGCSPLQQRSKTINNGLSPFSTALPTTKARQFQTTPTKTTTMAAATASATPPTAHLNPGLGTSTSASIDVGSGLKSDNGVIDYTINHTSPSSATAVGSNNNNNQKFTTHAHISSSSSGSNNSGDIGRHPILSAAGTSNNNTTASCGSGYGGRLQFFKEGKVILELQRSKDGEKGGWISVPRKTFRSPAATSSTVTPTSAACAAYPKNESSTSLSFSDDNSSIQSSPWQRDHCWKQAAPRRGISKEMAVLYRRPKCMEFTKQGWQLALKKRRRPYDVSVGCGFAAAFKRFREKSLDSIFESSSTTRAEDKPLTTTHKSAVIKEEKSAIKNDDSNFRIDGDVSTSSSSSSLSSTATLIGVECTGAAVSSEVVPAVEIKFDIKSVKIEVESESIDGTTDNCTVEKMNTSDDDEIMIKKEPLDEDPEIMIKKELPDEDHEVNGTVDEEKTVSIFKTTSIVRKGQEEKGAGKNEIDKSSEIERRGDKRLKIPKPRAKLTTIIQKLIDNVPARTIQPPTKLFPLLPPSGASGSGINHQANNNALLHKISPPAASAATTASRLVEYHVSPRKRILRQFEKVSLEDNTTVAGGKRSRAKNAMPTNSQQQHHSAKSSPSRVQSSSVYNTSLTTATHALTSNGGHKQTISSGSKAKATATATATASSTVNTAPARLYSSYSIHSLLGGGSGSSAPTCSKKVSDAAAIVSSSLSYQQQHQQLYTDPSYLRTMLVSPKSPDSHGGNGCGGGKSPSSSASNKKRSPPYASSMHEAHIRSPTVAHSGGCGDYGRRSPRVATPQDTSSNAAAAAAVSNYKMRYATDHNIPSPPTPHSHPQSFYPSYMMSPNYVHAPSQHQHHPHTSSAISPNATRHSSAYSSTPASAAAAAALSVSASTTYIPQTGGVVANTSRELSPPRSSTASPRDSTPRTVPKKTASIRRQFASPTTTSVQRSCPSPNDRASVCEDAVAAHHERKTPVGNVPPPPPTHLLQRGSPLAVGAVPMTSSLQYYMYPPPPSGVSPSPHAPVPAPPTVNPAAYIPSVMSPSYFPYISTLAALRHNPMWLHHYPGSVPSVLPPNHPAASSPSARLSPPFHVFPPYNGVGAAAAVAAAHHAHMLAPGSGLHSVGGVLGMNAVGGAQSPKLTDIRADYSTATAKSGSTMVTSGSLSATLYPSSSIKDELSSDVPLNLSKH